MLCAGSRGLILDDVVRVETFNAGTATLGRRILNWKWGIPLAEIQVHEGESLDSALRRFKRKVVQEDIIKDIKRHAFYLKPGEKKRVKSALARKRARKKRGRDGESVQPRS